MFKYIDLALTVGKCPQVILALTSLCVTGFTYAQTIASRFETIVRSSSDPEEIKSKVQRLIDSGLNEAQVLYLRGVCETDAAKSVDIYQTIWKDYPASDVAEMALLKIGQYYFSRGLYVAARAYFSELPRNFPKSTYIDEAKYFAAISLCSTKKYDLCSKELGEFVSEHRGSPLRQIAQDDLEQFKATSEDQFVDSKPPKTVAGQYAIQIGAFTQINYALNLRREFEGHGYDARVSEKTVGDTRFYLVLLGSFETQKAAQEFGEQFKREHGKPFRVIKN